VQRERDLARLASGGPFDLLVVGGGAAGAATLRAATLRGLSSVLCERADFASGTTSRSSRLIHGGLRYLEHGHVNLVRESLSERRTLVDTAPHLVEPLLVHIPLYRGGRRAVWQVALGLRLYDLLAGGSRLGPSRVLPPDRCRDLLPGLAADGLRGIGLLVDARALSPERLVIENLIDAERLGAVAVNHLELESLVAGGSGFRACLRDRDAGGLVEVEAAALVSAAGPWVAEVERRAGASPRPLRQVRGSHLLLPLFPGAPERALLVEARRDGRPFFILPWDGVLLVGTTEVEEDGEPGESTASAAEIDYLLAELVAVWPAARGIAPLAAYAGVRSLPADGSDVASASRRHKLEPASARGGPRGFYSLIGGKLTTHRLQGEEAARTVACLLGRGDRGAAEPTRRRPLPGAQCDPEPTMNPAALAARFGLSAAVAEALLRRWGCRAWAVAVGIGDEGPLAGSAGLHAAEIRFALEHEGALGLDDVLLRRTNTWEAPALTAAGVRAAALEWAAVRTGVSHAEVTAGSSAAAAAAEASRVIDLLARLHARRL
jgi:glycerol-3-phosphate dehydrogenase